MAKTITFVKRSTLPAAVKGKIGTSQVTINGNGQVVLSSIATKALNGSAHVGMAFAGDATETKVYLFVETAKAVVKADKNDLIKLNVSQKSKTVSFSGAAIFKAMAQFGAEGNYEYQKSGNQSFPAEYDAKMDAVVFTIPVGSLTPKPVVHREKKVKVLPGVGIKAEAGKIEAVAPEETLELDVA